MQITQLIRSVVMSIFENPVSGKVADSGGSYAIRRLILRIVAKTRHQAIKIGNLRGKEVREYSISSVTNGLTLVLNAAFGLRASEWITQRRKRDLVVLTPRIKHRGVHHCKRANHHKPAGVAMLRCPNGRVVPQNDRFIRELLPKRLTAHRQYNHHAQNKS